MDDSGSEVSMFAKQLLLLRGDPLFEKVTHGGRKLASQQAGRCCWLLVLLVQVSFLCGTVAPFRLRVVVKLGFCGCFMLS